MCQNLVMQLFNSNLYDTFAPSKWDTNVAKLVDLPASKQVHIAITCNKGLNFDTFHIADVAKLVDALDLGSSAARHGGSSPSIRTIKYPLSPIIISSGLRVLVYN